MSEKKLRIAVISDLHCHPKRSAGNDTYLLTDMLRTPSNDHPVESLLKVIKKEELSVELTLCPGDFTDKSDLQGFISGWGFSLEISNELKSKDIIATVGNHDVDVYQKNSNYSLTNAKGIKRDFPMKDDAQRDKFWSQGCVFVERDDYRVLVINSSHFHYNKESSGNGNITDDGLEYIENYLKDKNDEKIQIAMSHHPPIAHSIRKLGEDDKIVNGESLLDLLGKYNFDLFIYGHKHDPVLKYYNTTSGNYKIALFSSGSFSSSSNLMFTGIRNAFHVLELSKVTNVCKGTVETWTFIPNSGWIKNFDTSAFAPITGFGSEKSIDEIYTKIVEMFALKNKLAWIEITEQIGDINNLIPDDSKKLDELLKRDGYVSDKHLWECPTFIFNSNSK
ncbi:metallophosphoesterase [Arcicella sp. DC2W]|uniref:Metallophosphoesterase n=1 Tax=Arcicella gelida TaxID=2984195 RepID=A0ABU5S1Q8_9BACT|nr:metallophosphoesterase [Arcicella sp. DC2W]MEA5402404.1 metallophosphoesterase [Arcicella sp. DC2W]